MYGIVYEIIYYIIIYYIVHEHVEKPLKSKLRHDCRIAKWQQIFANFPYKSHIFILIFFRRK